MYTNILNKYTPYLYTYTYTYTYTHIHTHTHTYTYIKGDLLEWFTGVVGLVKQWLSLNGKGEGRGSLFLHESECLSLPLVYCRVLKK